ncbi:hypothetical protein J6W78_06605 [bacterium]|nr:hypothetical protein [bacterium]
MENKSNAYYQIANRKFIEKEYGEYGKSLWVQISGHKDLNGADALFWCVLVEKNNVDVVFRDHSWDVPIGEGGPGFIDDGDNVKYRSNKLGDEFEPLLYYREFYGIKKPVNELSQEFILLNNIYFDEQKKAYCTILENGTTEEVVRVIGENTFLIKLSYLTRYAAAKQMAAVLFYDIRTNFDVDTKELGVKKFSDEHKDKNVFYQVYGGNLEVIPKNAFSVLTGKKIIYPGPVETCGYWPFEKEKEFVEFLIGIDENGNEKSFTCNPDKLANYFGNNRGAPLYLTPVFFKREVLLKYISKPDLYSIDDGYLRCNGLWGIAIDNDHKDCISVYLGDLGRDLPESEMLYWKSFNIVSDEGVSVTSFKRDFLGIPADSDMIDHKFKGHYIETNEAWNRKFGWPLFVPLTNDDQHNFDTLRIPLTEESQPEFDGLILSLVKVLIDSLNEKKFQENIESEKDLKGIGKLEKWLERSGYNDFKTHIKFLRNLQELRSKGTGHRKGNGYNKIASSFGVGDKKLKEVFEDILSKADAFLIYMNNLMEK